MNKRKFIRIGKTLQQINKNIPQRKQNFWFFWETNEREKIYFQFSSLFLALRLAQKLNEKLMQKKSNILIEY